MKKVGIDAIDFYIPPIALPIKDLAEARNIEPAKLEFGLGLKFMAVTDINEDTASMAANALLKLILNNNINPNKIGRIYLGTESSLDAAKPSATYAVGIVEEKLKTKFGERCFRNCDVLDLTFACIGAVDALENCLDWVRNNEDRLAIVIASDVAKYELNSPGEYTQGAGAIGLLIKENPSILEIKDQWGIAMESVSDFFKPRKLLKNSDLKNIQIKDFLETTKQEIEIYLEEPVFDGQFSNLCYKTRIEEALEHFHKKFNTNFLNDWDHLIFHLPYAFQGRRMILDIWLNWLKQNNVFNDLEEEIGSYSKEESKMWKKSALKSKLFYTFIKSKIESGEKASSLIGNMYTASIFMSFLSLLSESLTNKKNIEGNTIGFLAYGSGSKSKIFQGEIQKNWSSKIKHLDLFKSISSRKEIDFSTYEKLHNKEITDPIINKESIALDRIESIENKTGYRIYN
jgi:hydroxymethylglutaryl-CoA synthase